MDNKKILGFCTIHYCGDYYKEALLSVVDHVDKMVIAYSANPSQGHSNNTQVPDSKEKIYKISKEVLGDKLIWDEKISYPAEYYHREVMNNYTKDFDAIITTDCDEVMVGIDEALEYAFNNEEEYFGLNNYLNFFRSFSWICKDGFRPIRIKIVGRNNGLQNLNCPMTVLHFSCCQRREIMEYKYSNFGHASEIRPNYLKDIFYKWTPDSGIKHLHPVSEQIWEHAEWFDRSTLPEFLHQHKNYLTALIE